MTVTYIVLPIEAATVSPRPSQNEEGAADASNSIDWSAFA